MLGCLLLRGGFLWRAVAPPDVRAASGAWTGAARAARAAGAAGAWSHSLSTRSADAWGGIATAVATGRQDVLLDVLMDSWIMADLGTWNEMG